MSAVVAFKPTCAPEREKTLRTMANAGNSTVEIVNYNRINRPTSDMRPHN
jgi:hypothetical protein